CDVQEGRLTSGWSVLGRGGVSSEVQRVVMTLQGHKGAYSSRLDGDLSFVGGPDESGANPSIGGAVDAFNDAKRPLVDGCRVAEDDDVPRLKAPALVGQVLVLMELSELKEVFVCPISPERVHVSSGLLIFLDDVRTGNLG